MSILQLIRQIGFEVEETTDRVTFVFNDSGDEICLTNENNYLRISAPEYVLNALKNDFASVIISNSAVRWNPRQIRSFLEWLKNRDFELSVPTPSNLERLKQGLDKADKTEKEYLRKQRIFQNRLRDYLLMRDGCCVITGITEKEFLVASHIVAWKDDEDTRLDVDNLLLLSTAYDRAFDRHLISFDDMGKIAKSNRTTWETLNKMGICETARIPIPNERQQMFLKKHREEMQEKDKTKFSSVQ